MNFSVNGNVPAKSVYRDIGVAGYDKRISLVNAFVGPNASGKTNVLKTIAILRHLIVDSFDNYPDDGMLPYYPHALRQEEKSSLSVKFSMNNRLFSYSVEFDREKILIETLREYSKTTNRFTEKTLFKRSWGRGEYLIEKDSVFGLQSGELRKNASVISVAKQLPDKYRIAKEIARYWEKEVVISEPNSLGHFANVMRKLKLRFDGKDEKIENFLDNEPMRERVNSILANYDLGYVDIKRRIIDPESDFTTYEAIHNYQGGEFKVNWNSESSGTQRLFRILIDAITAMSSENGTVMIDELDAYLHPDIVNAIVELFLDPDSNINGTQLIFSTHSHRILEQLDKQEIFFVEKNDYGESETWRLDEMKGVKAADNHYLKYVSGAYGAKPRI